jgi:cysteinyl-tRNA synthetase
MRAGASGRVEADEYDKDDVRDFALWKADPGECSWESPFGRGRPGWHIECSAMSMKYLGESFDIHTGGVDNIFPHHENEIAQSQGATGLPLARYWLHGAHLIVEGEKMSKSKGNVVTLRDLLAQGNAPRTLRYYLLSVHYRQVIDLTAEGLAGARQTLDRLDGFAERLASAVPATAATEAGADEAVRGAAQRFDEALDDDLNAARALGALFEGVRALNAALDSGGASAEALAAGSDLLGRFQSQFGIALERQSGALEAHLAALIEAREAARRRRDFAEADRLRGELLAQGITLEDTAKGPRWRRSGSS